MSNRIVEHHIKYVETHGYDESIFITDTEHQQIDHRKLFPDILPDELASISRKAYFRTEKAKILKTSRIRQEIASMPTEQEMMRLVREKPII